MKKIKNVLLFLLLFDFTLIFFSFNVFSFYITEIQPNPNNSSLEYIELYLNNTIINNNTKIILIDEQTNDTIFFKNIKIVEGNKSNISIYNLSNYSYVFNSSILISQYPIFILKQKNYSYKGLIVFLNSKIGNGLNNNGEKIKIILKNNFSESKILEYNNTIKGKSLNYNFKNKSYYFSSENPLLINNKTIFNYTILNNTININNDTNSNYTNNNTNTNNTLNNTNTNNDKCIYNNLSIVLEEKIFDDKIKFKIKNNTYKKNNVVEKYNYTYYFTDLDDNVLKQKRVSSTNYYKSFKVKTEEKDLILKLKVEYKIPCNNKTFFKEKIVLYKNKNYEEKNDDCKKLLEEKTTQYNNLLEENVILKQQNEYYKKILEDKNKKVVIKSFYTKQKYLKDNNTFFYTIQYNKNKNSIKNNNSNTFSYKVYYCNLKFLRTLKNNEFNNSSYEKFNFSVKNINNLFLFILKENNTSKKIYYYKRNYKNLKEKNVSENKSNTTINKENISVKGYSNKNKVNTLDNNNIVPYIIKESKTKKQQNKTTSNNRSFNYKKLLRYSFITFITILLLYLLFKKN